MDNALNHGAGYENGDEHILFDLLNGCRDQMLIDVEEKGADLSVEDYEKVYDLLKIESERYSSVDGDNRIRDVFEKLVSTTKGKTRITENGAYVRGADYYGNLGK